MANTPAKRPAKKAAPRGRTDEDRLPTDLEVLSRDEDEDTFVGRLFGEEEFTFHSQANDYLMFLAAHGEVGRIVDLLHSLILVEADEDGDFEDARSREKRRFDDLLASQSDLRTERIMQLYADIVEAAGNGQSESSTD